MPEIILHHYPQSPVAEKVRVILGIKSLHWYSVEIPRIPPKPDLMPLTGGYRRTPVMQIGADIFCDSQCIIRELERRYPEPTIFPGDSTELAWGIGRWTDGPLFSAAITVVLGSADNIPPDFAADRGRLYFGPDFTLASLQARVSHCISQIRGQLTWFEQHLGSERLFLSGSGPGLIDALCYYLVWFLRGRWADGSDFMAQFPGLEQWQQRIEEIGHGYPENMEAKEALEIARRGESISLAAIDPGDSIGFKAGMEVSIAPEGDGGDPEVSGTLKSLNHETISITRNDDRVGEVVVHFPTVGYTVKAV
jgi:glutathione S-transferase